MRLSTVVPQFILLAICSLGLAGGDLLAQHGGACNCCPCPSAQAESPDPTAGEEELPEVADLLDDSGFASAPQAAVPNAIGDSVGGCLSVSSVFGTVYGCQQGGYTFKATNNNNAIPTNRVYYSYQYFSDAYSVAPAAAGATDIDLQRHIFGAERLLIGDIYALGVQIPVHNQLASELDTGVNPTARDTEIGNMTVYSKHVLFRRNNTTISGGFALGLPTGDELSLTAGGDTIHIENDAWTLTPYLATLVYDPCRCYYYQIFGQFDFALDDNEVYLNGTNVGDLKDVTLFRLDGSFGYWLHRDCCDNGVVGIAELHFATSVDGDASLTSGGNTVTYGNNRQLNATLGLGIINRCWSLYPGVSLPLLDSPDRAYDWEAQILFERRL